MGGALRLGDRELGLEGAAQAEHPAADDALDRLLGKDGGPGRGLRQRVGDDGDDEETEGRRADDRAPDAAPGAGGPPALGDAPPELDRGAVARTPVLEQRPDPAEALEAEGATLAPGEVAGDLQAVAFRELAVEVGIQEESRSRAVHDR